MLTLIWARDRFRRTVASGWGTDERGTSYTLRTATGSVAVGAASLAVPASGRGDALLPITTRDVTVYGVASYTQLPTTTGAEAIAPVLVAREQADGTRYELRVDATSAAAQAGGVASLRRRDAAGNAGDILISLGTGWAFPPNTRIAMRLDLRNDANGDVQYAAKVWLASDPEPARPIGSGTVTNSTKIDQAGAVAFGAVNTTGTAQPVRWHDVEVMEWCDDTVPPDPILEGFTAKRTADERLQADWPVQQNNQSNYTIEVSLTGERWQRAALLSRMDTGANLAWPFALGEAVHVRVLALNAAGGAPSYLQTAVPALPPAATNVSATQVSSRPAVVDETYTFDADRVLLEHREVEQNGSGIWQREASGRPGSDQHGLITRTDRSVISGVYGAFRWRIVTENDAGTTAGTPTATITVPPPPGRPHDLVATRVNDRSAGQWRVQLGWQNDAGGTVTSARLERRLANGAMVAAWSGTNAWQTVHALAVAATTATDTVPSNGVWEYRVVRTNATDDAVSETATIAIDRRRPYLALVAGDTPYVFDGTDLAIDAEGYVPAVSVPKQASLGNTPLHEDVTDGLSLNIHGGPAPDAAARAMDDINFLLQAAEHDGAVLLYAPQGSTLPDPLQARIVARPKRDDLLGKRWALTGLTGDLLGSTLPITRRGLWTRSAPVLSAVSATTAVPGIMQTTLPDHPQTPSPMQVTCTLGTRDQVGPAPPCFVVLADDPKRLALLAPGIGDAPYSGRWTSQYDQTGGAWGDFVGRYTPNDDQPHANNWAFVPDAMGAVATRYTVLACVRPNGAAGYEIAAEIRGWGRTARTPWAVVERGSGCQIVALGTATLAPMTGVEIRVHARAEAVGGSLDINYLAILAEDTVTTRVIAVSAQPMVPTVVPTPDAPVTLTITNHPQARTPTVAYGSTTPDGYGTVRALPTGWLGDAALYHTGSSVAALFLATASDRTRWRPDWTPTLQAARWDGFVVPV